MKYVYIVACKDGTLYTGWTTNIENRIKQHNRGKGAKYTRNRFPVELKYYEQFETKTEALRREYRIKQLTRNEKLNLIAKGREDLEKTFVILKPDAVERKLVGEIISRIERKKLSIIHVKMEMISRELACEHYKHIKELDIFDDMIDYVTSGKVLFLIVEGRNAIQNMRLMAGKMHEAPPGTIRGDLGNHRFKSLIHTSDSPESFIEEVKRFFPEIPKKL